MKISRIVNKEKLDDKDGINFKFLKNIANIELVTFLIGILSFFITIYTSNRMGAKSESLLLDGVIVSLAAMFITDKIVSIIRNQSRDIAINELVNSAEYRINENIYKLRNDVGRAANFVYIGGKDDGLHYLQGRLRHAAKCYNTFVAYGVESPQQEALLYSETAIKEISQGFFEMLTRRSTVVCTVISEDTRFFLESINSLITGPEEDKVKGTHVFGIMKKSFPIMNFTIIEYSDKKDDREVIFGWGHHKDDWSGCTFSSSERHVVGTFMSYYKAISSKKLCDWHSDANEINKPEINNPISEA